MIKFQHFNFDHLTFNDNLTGEQFEVIHIYINVNFVEFFKNCSRGIEYFFF